MELAANVWPVVDADTGIVLRFFMRAYAMTGDDEVISRTLLALAPADYHVARVFRIPLAMQIASEYGTLKGARPIGEFHERRDVILDSAYRELEADFAKLQGIVVEDFDEGALGIAMIPRFPVDPYLVVTILIERPDGQLVPQLRVAAP